MEDESTREGGGRGNLGPWFRGGSSASFSRSANFCRVASRSLRRDLHLGADDLAPKTADSLKVSLSLPADGVVAGRDEKLVYHIVDARTGKPVTDLQPYLAAYGHTLVVSEDTIEYVHAHPVELLPDKLEEAAGGPELTFKALLPKPGRYRLWTQLRRGDVVSTVQFTVTAASPQRR